MNVDVKQLPDSQIELTVELDGEDLKKYKDVAVKNLAGRYNIKGFRPGQATAEALERKFGKDTILKETVEIAVKKSYTRAVREKEIEVLGDPKIEIKELPDQDADSFSYQAIVLTLPEIKLGNYDSISIKAEEASVEDAEVDSALKILQRSRASYATVNRPAKKGDRVEIDFSSSVNGTPLEGGSSTQHPLIIGEGHFMKGFEDELMGMKEGQEKSFSLVAPKDYYRKELAGRAIDFKVKVLLVQDVNMPDVDDSLASSVGKFSSVGELRSSIRDGLKEEKEQRNQEKNRLKIIEKIVSASEVFVPQEMVDQELERMDQEFAGALARMNIDEVSYLSHLKKTKEDLKKEWQGQAVDRVKAALVLREIAKKENVTVSEDEILERINELVRNVSPEEASNIDTASLTEYVRGTIRNEKVFEFLESKVTRSLD